jgi:glyoxylase-like metal-dependent hydrolase (beta-lactamase superfamily II)
VNDRFYFRQLLSGRDFANDDGAAQQMVNFVYALGDRVTGDAMLVDPAYDPRELLALVQSDEMNVTGVLLTHYHPDHAGGSLFGTQIEGIRELLEEIDVPVHVHRDEVAWISEVTGVDESAMVAHESGDRVMVGDLDVTLIHTPGHTPGSQCLLADGRFLTGDTLFVDGCGRTDLPGSDPEEMYRTLSTRLSAIGDDAILFPGHQYSVASSAPMGVVRRENFVLAPRTREQWFAMFAS